MRQGSPLGWYIEIAHRDMRHAGFCRAPGFLDGLDLDAWHSADQVANRVDHADFHILH